MGCRMVAATWGNGNAYQWTYDSFGNRLSQTVTAGMGVTRTDSFSGGNNRVDGMTYDAAGNALNDGTQVGVLSYDAESRLSNSDSTHYVYDAAGQRVAKYGGGTLTNVYIYDAAGRMVTELDGNYNLLLREVYAGGRHLGTYDANGNLTYALVDWLGTERARANASGTICQTTTSQPFGGEQQVSGSCSPSTNFFTGKERDSESGLDYFGARYYASSMGRFTSPDPVIVTPERLMNPQELNLYAYVQNNPLRYIDPTGEVLIAADGHNDYHDLCQIAGDACKDRLKIDDKTGNVTFDTKGLDLSKNEGAKLLNDVIGSKNTYEFSEGPTVNTSNGPQRIDSIKAIPQYIANLPIFSNQSGDSRQPRAGVADVVGIDVDNGHIVRTQVGLGVSPFWTVAFHELAEAYEKIDNRQSSYQAGHNAALQREMKLRDQRPYLKQNAPGAGGPGTGIIRK